MPKQTLEPDLILGKVTVKNVEGKLKPADRRWGEPEPVSSVPPTKEQIKLANDFGERIKRQDEERRKRRSDVE